MRGQSPAMVLAERKDRLVSSVDSAIVLGTDMLGGSGGEWTEEAKKREESGWGAWWRREGESPGGQRRRLPQAVHWARLRESEPPHCDPSAFRSFARPSLLF